jgi:hypothetical protein
MKKSQVEMFGFAIIVILVIIGLFLLIAFRIMGEKEVPVNKEESFAVSFVSVFPRVDTDCGSISYLIQECALGRQNAYCEPCEVLNETAVQILSNTASKRGIPYYFLISTSTKTLTEVHLQCNESVQHYAPAAQPISLFENGRLIDTLSISFTICR